MKSLEEQARDLMRGRKGRLPEQRPPVPTGSLLINQHLNGGYRRGSLTAVFGDRERAQLLFWACAAVHQQGGLAVYVAMEGPLDRFLANELGVPKSMWVIETSDSDHLEALIEARCLEGADLLVIDALDAAFPGDERFHAHRGLEAYQERMLLQHLMEAQGRLPDAAVLVGRHTTWSNVPVGIPAHTHLYRRALFVEDSPRKNRLRVTIASSQSTLASAVLDIPLEGKTPDTAREHREIG